MREYIPSSIRVIMLKTGYVLGGWGTVIKASEGSAGLLLVPKDMERRVAYPAVANCEFGPESMARNGRTYCRRGGG